MGRPQENKQIISTTVRLSPEMHDKIAKDAKINFRSISNQIEMIITKYYENQGE